MEKESRYIVDGEEHVHKSVEEALRYSFPTHEDLDNYPDNAVMVHECELTPAFKLNLEKLMDLCEVLLEEVSPDGYDDLYEGVKENFKATVDFDKVNKNVPKLWYPSSMEMYPKGSIEALLKYAD